MTSGGQVFVTFPNFGPGRGGMTRSVLRLTRVFADGGWDANVVLVTYKRLNESGIDSLRAEGHFDDRVRVHRLWREGAPSGDGGVLPESLDRAGIEIVPRKRRDGRKHIAVRCEGRVIEHRLYRHDGSLERIDRKDHLRHTTVRELSDERGRIVIRQSLQPDGQLHSIDYVEHDGSSWLTVERDIETGHLGFTKLNHSDSEPFPSFASYAGSWLADLVRVGSAPHSLLFAHNPATYPVVAAVPVIDGLIGESRVARIAMLHEDHLEAGPLDVPAVSQRLDSRYDALVANFSSFDRLVTFTGGQAHLITTTFPQAPPTVAMPHPVIPPTVGSDVERSPFTLVVLSRLVAVKRVELAILAVARVAVVEPRVRLVVYGEGTDRERLERLVDAEGLRSCVTFAGYTNRPHETLAAAMVLLVTSESEGYANTIAESMSVGTPVVAYDVRYGPRELIRDGVDGSLVPDGDEEAYVSAIVRLLNDQDLWNRYSDEARSIVDRHPVEAYRSRWMDLAAHLTSPM
jgi:glycosyltransferase involved in cell wall biosynthesis